MAILDGFPHGEAEARQAALFGADLFDRQVARRKLSPRERSVVALLKEGLSLADVFEITREERDAVLLLACQHLQRGDPASAKPLLTQLALLEPTDGRTLYALGVAHQASGAPVLAGKVYLYAIALDATNPEPYLRLGECFLADGDVEGARGCFESGKILAGGGAGTPAQIAHADRMLAALPPPTAAA